MEFSHETRALLAGSFDPPTLGHLDLIQRAASICKKLIVGIAVNSSKKRASFSPDERLEMLKTLTQKIPNVEVVIIPALVSTYAAEQSISIMIRGVRTGSDIEREAQMAAANRALSGIETLLLPASGEQTHISSSLIKEIAALGGDLKKFIPDDIQPLVQKRLSSDNQQESCED